MPELLAVDLGVRTGLACFGDDGRLRWYRSTNFGSTARLRRGVVGVLAQVSDLARLALEGRGEIADIWTRTAEKRGVAVQCISAETWRQALLHPRQQRSGEDAKRHADELARRVIEWSGAPRPTSLRHDAAEAILLGLWAVCDCGWLTQRPPGWPGR